MHETKMNGRRLSEPASSAPSETAIQGSGSPLYSRVAEVLQRALMSGSIQVGTVLLEGPIADILKVTRSPVRQALQDLEAEGLLHRFEGRGLISGGAGVEPQRIQLTADMLGLDEAAQPVRKAMGWEAIYQEVERDVVHLAVFDAYRLNEVELARHFGVGRKPARDVLLRLESLGLVEKDARQRWAVIPFSPERINHLYELRWCLEPVALGAAMTKIGVKQVDAMAASLSKAIRAYPRVRREDMDNLERDLHVTLLSYGPNLPLLESLERTRCIVTLSKHVLGAVAPMPEEDPFLAEHLAVLKAVGDGDEACARFALKKHLETACVKVTDRAALVRNQLATPCVAYAG